MTLYLFNIGRSVCPYTTVETECFGKLQYLANGIIRNGEWKFYKKCIATPEEDSCDDWKTKNECVKHIQTTTAVMSIFSICVWRDFKTKPDCVAHTDKQIIFFETNEDRNRRMNSVRNLQSNKIKV